MIDMRPLVCLRFSKTNKKNKKIIIMFEAPSSTRNTQMNVLIIPGGFRVNSITASGCYKKGRAIYFQANCGIQRFDIS